MISYPNKSEWKDNGFTRSPCVCRFAFPYLISWCFSPDWRYFRVRSETGDSQVWALIDVAYVSLGIARFLCLLFSVMWRRAPKTVKLASHRYFIPTKWSSKAASSFWLLEKGERCFAECECLRKLVCVFCMYVFLSVLEHKQSVFVRHVNNFCPINMPKNMSCTNSIFSHFQDSRAFLLQSRFPFDPG